MQLTPSTRKSAMMNVLLRTLIVCWIWGAPAALIIMADEPAKPEQLPAPRELAPDYILPVDAPLVRPFERTSRYDVWQFYGVDRSGHFRARVIHSPYGAYYSHNGEPFPWVSTHELEFMPYVVD
jgi:hypothetical protein